MNKKNKGWSEINSLVLSKVLMYALFAMLVAALGLIPFISRWYGEISDGHGLIGGDLFIPVCIMLYICDIFGLAAVNNVRILLGNIGTDNVFTDQNTKCLRIISWCCIFVGMTFLFFGLWRFVFGFAAFFAFFMGFIMRVLKNVFEKAVEIKSENDFTI